MLLKNRDSEDLIEVSDVTDLINPFKEEIMGQMQSGQNEQPAEAFEKANLVFPSGEELPACWLDGDYKLKEE